MAGAARWKGSVKFGPLLQFPVIAASAVRETKFAFNQHHSECGGRVRQGKSVCEGCGELLEKDQIVRGYNGVPGVDEEYLDQLKADKSALLELDGLVPADQIDPRFYQKSYDVQPDKGGEKAYVLFLRLLESSGRVAIGKVVMSEKEFIVTIRPRDGVLAMEVMYWPEELLGNGAAKAAIEGVEVSESELKMGEQLVKFLSKDFEPGAYRNEWAAQLGEYLEAFTAGATPAALPKPRIASPALSLEDALAQSLAALQGGVDEKVAERTGKKAKVA
jgi:DNA end-binding protein Ku